MFRNVFHSYSRVQAWSTNKSIGGHWWFVRCSILIALSLIMVSQRSGEGLAVHPFLKFLFPFTINWWKIFDSDQDKFKWMLKWLFSWPPIISPQHSLVIFCWFYVLRAYGSTPLIYFRNYASVSDFWSHLYACLIHLRKDPCSQTVKISKQLIWFCKVASHAPCESCKFVVISVHILRLDEFNISDPTLLWRYSFRNRLLSTWIIFSAPSLH